MNHAMMNFILITESSYDQAGKNLFLQLHHATLGFVLALCYSSHLLSGSVLTAKLLLKIIQFTVLMFPHHQEKYQLEKISPKNFSSGSFKATEGV